MRMPRVLARLIAVAMLAGSGCSGSSADPMNNSADGGPVEVPPWACVPGETQPCDCPDDLDGLRTCDPEGTAFGACDCSPGAVSQGPPPTSTGTDSETGDTGTSTAGTTAATDTTAGGNESTTGMGATTEPDPTTMGGGSSSSEGGGGSSSSEGGGASSSGTG